MEEKSKHAKKRIDPEQLLPYSGNNAGRDLPYPYTNPAQRLRSTFSAGNRETYASMPLRSKAVGEKVVVEYSEKQGSANLIYREKGKDEIRIIINNLDMFDQEGKYKKPSAERLMFYIIMCVAEQYLPRPDRNIQNMEIELLLSALVDDGVYKNENSIRNAMGTNYINTKGRRVSDDGTAWNIKKQLMSYGISVGSKDGGYDEDVLIPHIHTCTDGRLKIKLNPYINWYELCRYCSVYNTKWFELNSGAFDLLLYILQKVGNELSANRKKIEKVKGEYEFSITLKRLQLLGATLRDKEIDKAQGVPEPHNPGEAIGKRIEDMIKEINSVSIKYDLGITLSVFERAAGRNIWEWLENELITVIVSKEYREKFYSMAKNGKKVLNSEK